MKDNTLIISFGMSIIIIFVLLTYIFICKFTDIVEIKSSTYIKPRIEVNLDDDTTYVYSSFKYQLK